MASTIRPNGKGFKRGVPVPRSTFANWVGNPNFALHTNVRKEEDQTPFQLTVLPDRQKLKDSRSLG